MKLTQTHAALAHVLDDDHRRQSKEWALRPIESMSGITVQQVTTIGAETARRLTEHLTPGTEFRLGTQTTALLDSPRILEAADEEAVLDVEPRREHTVEFLSPTAIRSGQRFTPLLDPARIFRSVNARWNTVFGRPLSDVRPWSPEDDDVWVSHITGKTRTFKHAQIHISGFTGRMRFVCDTPEAAATWTPLLEFARLVGIGAYTARGLGSIELHRSWIQNDAQ
ncbi:MAG: CRISPR system precrRNA processing endoribonuclease RAMP protein Cas6 [Gordonia sp. (in: high G+C Gram-positive bacteria)]|uniref:CRISPR system precrRNA processing endoribonuclease RAMP protein Cas6 n=1 Tax=Gordonia sp. (in: high G+C Gram-positive bacteria) TaxID=84139 RepID=UPI0039E26816